MQYVDTDVGREKDKLTTRLVLSGRVPGDGTGIYSDRDGDMWPGCKMLPYSATGRRYVFYKYTPLPIITVPALLR